MEAFDLSLGVSQSSGYLPQGYGLHSEEWEDGIYPSFEYIPAGRQGNKEMRISLPDHIWRPRAELWGRALHLLNQITYMNSN